MPKNSQNDCMILSVHRLHKERNRLHLIWTRLSSIKSLMVDVGVSKLEKRPGPDICWSWDEDQWCILSRCADDLGNGYIVKCFEYTASGILPLNFGTDLAKIHKLSQKDPRRTAKAA